MKSGLFIFRHAALYRFPIYSLIDKEFNIKFCFCKNPVIQLKMLDYNQLKKVELSLNEISLPFGFYYLRGALSQNFKNFDFIFISGDIRDISSWLLLLKARFLRKKIYYWTHGWYGKENLLVSLVKKIYYHLGNEVFLYGEYAKRLMIKNGLSENKLYVIYNSLDHLVQKKLRKSLKLNDTYKLIFNNSDPVLLFIGRLEANKQLDLIIKALKKLLKAGLNCNLIFIGDGQEKENLIRTSDTLGLNDRVFFYGETYDELTISNLIYNADLCISPGNVGLTALHSLTYGTPVITHNKFPYQNPEFEAIIPGKSGNFFEYGSVESLTQVINEWFIEHPKKTMDLIDECYEVIDKNYNPDYQISILKNVIDE